MDSIKTVIKHTKRRHHHHRRPNKISQKIELKKQHFKCIINLNTTICGNEAHRSKLNTKICTKCVAYGNNRESPFTREPISSKPLCYTRIAPYCFREKCRGMKRCRCQEIRERRHRETMAKHHQNNRRKYTQDTRDSRVASKLPDRHRKHKKDALKMSPISPSPLKDKDALNHLYEDISNDSLDKVLETPMSYKYIKYVEDKAESKLDTLIRRTKERERKQTQSRSRPSYSISSVSNMSFGECPMDLCSLDRISLHSQSTLVLEKTQSDFVYISSESQEYSRSPSEFTLNIPRKYEHAPLGNDFNMNIPKKYEYDRTYSPVSPQENDFIMNIPEKYEHAQIYSPGFPSTNDFNMNISKKYEHDCVYSHVTPEQNDFNVLKNNGEFNSPGFQLKDDSIMNIPKKYEHDRTVPVSPQQNDFIMNIPRKHEHYQTHSLGIPLKNYFSMNIPKKYEHDFKMDNIKVEPLDSGIYSPTFDYSNEEIKKEVKIKSEPFVDVVEMLKNIKKEV